MSHPLKGFGRPHEGESNARCECMRTLGTPAKMCVLPAGEGSGIQFEARATGLVSRCAHQLPTEGGRVGSTG
eukprot:3198260-Alexandrium_andersonii.AAC.1